MQIVAQRIGQLYTPTLLLVGGSSPAFVQESSRIIARALPHSRVAALPGQEHLAMYTSPELFLNEVINLLTEVD